MSCDSSSHETKQASAATSASTSTSTATSQAAKRRARKRALQQAATSTTTGTSTGTSKAPSLNDDEEESEEKDNKSSNVTVIYGDLFKAPQTDALAHCVSVDLSMSKGIAVDFVKHFGGREELRAQKAGVGQVAILQHGSRYIYYLITKTRYYHKPTLSSLQASLLCMKQHMIENGVMSLAMPKIGCGLDLLSWDDVLPMIKRIFDTDIRVTIYLV